MTREQNLHGTSACLSLIFVEKFWKVFSGESSKQERGTWEELRLVPNADVFDMVVLYTYLLISLVQAAGPGFGVCFLL